jgi:phytoene synthase
MRHGDGAAAAAITERDGMAMVAPRAASHLPFADPDDRAACRALIRCGSRSFFCASLVLPRRIREPALALYAFCRLADDAVDDPEGGPEALAELQARLDRIYAGQPLDIAADRAFADVVGRFGIPYRLPAALLEGFSWDQQARRYDTIGELRAYGARVAGAVGAMMAMLMGVRDPSVAARACDLGVAMQLTNIARDVGEDARNGRLYLPQQWLREAGIDPDAFLAAPRFGPRLASVVRGLLASADSLYARADAGIPALPARCRPGITAASRLYQGIGHELARQGHDSVSTRAIVPGRRKLALMAQAGLNGAPSAANLHAPALPETRYLVDAVRAAPPLDDTRPAFPDEGAAWVCDLFLKLEERRSLEETGERP